jgi:hypothetical protein
MVTRKHEGVITMSKSWYFPRSQARSHSYRISNAPLTRSIAAIASEAILGGFNDREAAAWVKIIEPTARTKPKCIATYRTGMRKRGLTVPSSRSPKKAN